MSKNQSNNNQNSIQSTLGSLPQEQNNNKKQLIVKRKGQRQIDLSRSNEQDLVHQDLPLDLGVDTHVNNNNGGQIGEQLIELDPPRNPVLDSLAKANQYNNPVRTFNLGSANNDQLINGHGRPVRNFHIPKNSIGNSQFSTRGNKKAHLVASNQCNYIPVQSQSQQPLVSLGGPPQPPCAANPDGGLVPPPPPPPPTFLFDCIYGGTEYFKYKKKFYRKIFGIKLYYYIDTCWGRLPKKVAEKIWKLTLFTNSLNYAHYRSVIGSDDDMVNVINHWRLFRYASRDDFLMHLDAYYFHTCGTKSRHSERISHPNSKHALNQKNSRAYLNKLQPTEPWYKQLWDHWLIRDYVRPVLKGALYVFLTYQGVKYTTKRILPFKQKHQLIPFFPTFSLYFEEVIKIFPGGASLVSWLERHIYGNNRNSAWHKRSSSWSFFTRVREHKRINNDNSYFVDVCTASTLYQSQQELYFLSNRFTEVDDGMIERWDEDVIIPAVTIPKPKKILVDYPFEPETHLYNTTFEPTRYPVEETHLGIYPLCFNLGDFVQPANSTDNLFCAWDLRVSSWDNSEVDEDKKGVFKDILSKVVQLDPQYNAEWFNNLKAQQKKNLIETDRKSVV